MSSAILFIFLLVLAIGLPLWLAGAGLLYAARRLKAPYFLLLLAVICLAPYLAYKHTERRWQLQAVPDALQVTTVAYSREESWGFGPGGNEAGFRAYPLPPDIAARIRQRGLGFFDTMPPNTDQDARQWRGQYTHWSVTPVQPDTAGWTLRPGASMLDVDDYVHRYACCIEIDAKLREQANAIVNSPGSYYAQGRIGMIVVSPAHKLVLYFYNG